MRRGAGVLSRAGSAAARALIRLRQGAGKFNRHVDIWDAISNQEYFSLEAFAHVLAQLSSLAHAPPALEQPPYMVLRKRKDYEVRRRAAGAAQPAGAAGCRARLRQHRVFEGIKR